MFLEASEGNLEQPVIHENAAHFVPPPLPGPTSVGSVLVPPPLPGKRI